MKVQVLNDRDTNELSGNVQMPASNMGVDISQSPRMQAQLKQRDELFPKINNTGLPDQLKSGVESLSGLSMDHVKVHYNSAQPAQLNAHAYAQGSDIHVAPGQEQHLPHEAWHVVQQAQGRVKPTVQMKAGVAVNDEEGLENEATVMGAKALATGGDVTQRLTSAQNTSVSSVLQKEAVIQLAYIGKQARFHVHQVGGDEHFKYGGEMATRQNFVHGGHINQANLQSAIAKCNASRGLHNVHQDDIDSYNTVIIYLQSLVIAAPAAAAPVAVAPPVAAPAPVVVVPPQGDFNDEDFM